MIRDRQLDGKREKERERERERERARARERESMCVEDGQEVKIDRHNYRTNR